ncbi:MAG TPA: glycosyltransferase family 1 protein [Pyrinomonadaceae bacterium]|jgi:glycosyltransferase involved in cell wall biosynthesis
MRIAIDGIPLAEPKTGIGHYTFELARGFAALAPEHDFELVAHVPIQQSLDDAFTSEPQPSNLRAVHAPVNSLSRRWWTIGLPLYVQRHKVALFHGTNYKIPLWNRCRTVVTIHDLSLLLHAHTHEEELVRRARLRLPAAARMASKIITDSESVKREICTHLGTRSEKIAVVPLAPRRAFRPVGAAEATSARHRLGVEDDFILFVGTVEPRKNLLTLVRAFAELVGRAPGLRPQLVIAGQKGWLTDELFALIEQSGLGRRILFTGYVSDADLAALYSSCRLSVYPSLYEGFGLPPLEAMSCGAPVITSRIPVIMETVGDAARLFNPTDVRELADCLHELWTNDAERQRLSAQGRVHAAGFTWERTARLTLDVYAEVLQGA